MKNFIGRKFPWFDNIQEIERRKYILRNIPNSNNLLLTISPSKFSWEYDFENPYGYNSELNWRSSILDKNGYEISGGLPKFQNFAEKRKEDGSLYFIDETISQNIGDRTALITRKEDGSLIIRSVYQDQVIFRTRGSYQLPQVEGSVDFGKHVMAVVRDKYPNLLDPTVLPNYDLHFEFVSPLNRIVIAYEQDDLIFIHAKIKETQELVSWEHLTQLAQDNSFTLVSIVSSLNDVRDAFELRDIINALELTGEWPYEGVVVRSPKGFMAKIKGDEYLAQHRLKSGFNYGRMVEVCENMGICSEEELKNYLENELFFDWETVVGIEEMFANYSARKAKYQQVLSEAETFVKNWQPKNSDNVQKQFALQVKEKPYNSIYFALFHNQQNKIDKAKEILFKKIIEGD